MEPIKLYSLQDDRKGYERDLSTGRTSVITWPESGGKGGVCGFGDVRPVGLRRKEEIFAAIYAREDRLHVALPPQIFSWPGSFRARRRSWLSRVKSFDIGTGSRTYARFFYTFVDSRHEFPGPEAMDIFYMIAWKTASDESIRDTIELWQNMPGTVDS